VTDVNFAANSNLVKIAVWQNLGMTFRRSLWMEIKDCAYTFCNHDDYNWDWSLLAVSQKCMARELTAIVSLAPRVFHLGQCGVHFKSNNCHNTSTLAALRVTLEAATNHLFPEKLSVTSSDSEPTKELIVNGGWGDVRDQQLCLKIATTES